ncbi:GTP cyclohydrolase II [Aciduricibacillus chroicocephali]|uniref:GTP cyclohydrolase II n=1 Tax=Aciduricibacillus chroicocephali TaxID=3054939 RepID=UPI003D646922
MALSVEKVAASLKLGNSIIIRDETNGKAAVFMLADQAAFDKLSKFKNLFGDIQLVLSAHMAKQLGYKTALSQQSCAVREASAQQIIAYADKLLHRAGEEPISLASSPVDIIAAADGGVLKSEGLAEAAVDLAKLAGAVPAGYLAVCEGELSSEENMSTITIQDMVDYRKGHENHIVREVETVLPSAFGDFQIVGYSNDLDDKEHIAIVKGDIANGEPVLARIHSECFTGDIFGSHRCDCGPQLHAALAKIEEAGRGIIIYMRQEGRGIGLINKLRAYKLQDEGRDTHQANLELGFKADAREYHLSAQILQDLGVGEVKLMTNNPDKISELKKYGINIIERIPLQTGLNENNKHYMETKLHKFGHLLNLHS